MELKRGQVEMGNMLLQTITSICVSEITGVKQLSPRMFGKVRFIQSKWDSAFISFINKNTVIIDLFIAVEYNTPIPIACRKLQKLIKKEIETLTGYFVKEVNVNVEEVWSK